MLLACLLAVAGCASNPTRVETQAAEIQAPVLVRALSLGARQITATEAAEEAIVLYEVRLEIRQVLAGAAEGSMEADVITVPLAASNPGYFRRGAEIVILLDPQRIRLSRPLYWRRFTRFACVASTEIAGSSLNLSDRQSIMVGDDTCLYYGP
jgi:hypothetical protein